MDHQWEQRAIRYVLENVGRVAEDERLLRDSSASAIHDGSGREPNPTEIEELAAASKAYLIAFRSRAAGVALFEPNSNVPRFPFDEILAGLLSAAGKAGEAAADDIRMSVGSRLRRFNASTPRDPSHLIAPYGYPPAFLDRWLLPTLWKDVVEPQFEAERRTGWEPQSVSPGGAALGSEGDDPVDLADLRPHLDRGLSAHLGEDEEDELDDRDETAARLISPAIPVQVAEAARDAFFAKTRAIRDGGIWARGRVAALLDPPAGIEVPTEVATLLRATRSLIGHRLIRFLVRRVFEQKIAGVVPCTRIRVRGGFKEIAAQLGFSGAKAADQVRRALTVIRISTLIVKGQRFEGLCMWSERGAAPGHPAEIIITVNDWAAPDYVCTIPRCNTGLKQLTPMPMREPPYVGSEVHHPSQAELQFLALIEFRRHARELAWRGSIEFSRPRWLEMANEVELPTTLLDDVLTAWFEGAEGVPPFLATPQPGRLSLGPSYANELALIVQAGQNSIRATLRQRQSRASRLARSGGAPQQARSEPTAETTERR